MEGMNQEKVHAYVEEKEALDTKRSPPSLALWFLGLLNGVFKTTFMEGPENYLTIYERDRKKQCLLVTLSTREKIAVGLQLGQFYTSYNRTANGITGPSHLMFRDWGEDQQVAYTDYWGSRSVGENPVLRGPIVGDYPQDQLTPHEEAELVEIRRLRAEAGPGERTVLRWHTVDFPGRMISH